MCHLLIPILGPEDAGPGHKGGARNEDGDVSWVDRSRPLSRIPFSKSMVGRQATPSDWVRVLRTPQWIPAVPLLAPSLLLPPSCRPRSRCTRVGDRPSGALPAGFFSPRSSLPRFGAGPDLPLFAPPLKGRGGDPGMPGGGCGLTTRRWGMRRRRLGTRDGRGSPVRQRREPKNVRGGVVGPGARPQAWRVGSGGRGGGFGARASTTSAASAASAAVKSVTVVPSTRSRG